MHEASAPVSFVLAAATGRAVPVRKGQVLTVRQVAHGQCLDLNVFSLDDPREHFHSGRTRGLGGVNPSVGAHLWSAPPRERPMMTIIEDTVGTNDVNYSRCSAFLYELHYGFDGDVPHSNCQDCFAEAVREWGLEPEQVHDSFNGFMNTRVVDGRLTIDRQCARCGDYLSFLAQMDVLAVPICCGGDLGATNNYELKGLAIEVRDATAEELKHLVAQTFRNQRKPARASARPVRQTDYTAAWPWAERVAETVKFEIELPAKSVARMKQLNAHKHFSDMPSSVYLRFVLMQWLERAHRRPGP